MSKEQLAEYANSIESNEDVLEVGSMNIKIETFQEKKAKKYVEAQGLDTALYKLGQLASRNQKAREMFDIVLGWKEMSEKNIVKEPELERQTPTERMTNQLSSFIKQVQKQPKIPKEVFDLKVSKMGLPFNEVDVDQYWNPVINVSFKGKNPVINGKKVYIKKRDAHFLRHLRNSNIKVPFHVDFVTKDLIKGRPDMTRFFAEKERRRTIKKDTFKAVSGRGLYTDETEKKLQVTDEGWETIKEQSGVWEMNVIDETDDRVICEPKQYLKEESLFEAELNNGFVVNTDATEKKVWVPKKFQRKAKKDGIWQMQIIKETDDKLFAKPVKFLNGYPKFITGTPVKEENEDNKEWYQIKTKDTDLHVIVPSKFQRKFRHVKGVWKLQVLDVRNGNMYCKPNKCITTKRKQQKQRPDPKAARPRNRKFRPSEQQVNSKLEQLMADGKVAL